MEIFNIPSHEAKPVQIQPSKILALQDKVQARQSNLYSEQLTADSLVRSGIAAAAVLRLFNLKEV